MSGIDRIFYTTSFEALFPLWNAKVYLDFVVTIPPLFGTQGRQLLERKVLLNSKNGETQDLIL
jgi:hypothetical protein